MSGLEDFCKAKWFLRINKTVQILLSLILVFALNYIAAKFYVREDITESAQYSLSPETKAYIKQIKEEVTIYVTIPRHTEDNSTDKIFQDVELLLREYEYTSREGGEQFIHVEYIDIFQQRRKAEELAAVYGLEKENVILLVCGDKQREITGTDLYEVKDGSPTAFKGEQEFTSALLDVTSEKQSKLYFTVGHGEMQIDSARPIRGLTQLSTFLRHRNIALDVLDLSTVAEVPEDADLVIIASPQVAFEGAEEDKLRRYMSERNGRMIVFLDPRVKSELDDLFYDWGILADDMVVIDKNADHQSTGGDLIIRNYGEHEITEFLVNAMIKIRLGLCQSVRPDPGAPIDDRLNMLSLIGSAGKNPETGEIESWAERDWMLKEKTFNPKTELPGPVSVAALSQRNVGSGLGLNIPGGRIIVFGNADFIANNYINTLGNKILVNNTINWLLDRTNQLNIPPKKLESKQIAISMQEVFDLALRMLIVPAAVAAIGIVVLILRRR